MTVAPDGRARKKREVAGLIPLRLLSVANACTFGLCSEFGLIVGEFSVRVGEFSVRSRLG
jgi:hypothetical protein